MPVQTLASGGDAPPSEAKQRGDLGRGRGPRGATELTGTAPNLIEQKSEWSVWVVEARMRNAELLCGERAVLY